MNENIADNGGIKLAFNVRLCFNITMCNIFIDKVVLCIFFTNSIFLITSMSGEPAMLFFFISVIFPQAYKTLVDKEGTEGALPGLGLTEEQLFFVGFARVSIVDH